jgi:hypothetical protein
MNSRYDLRPNPTPAGLTNGQIATLGGNELTRQRIAYLQSKKQQQQFLTPNEDDELANLMGQMNINRGGRRRRRTFRRKTNKKRSTKRRRR